MNPASFISAGSLPSRFRWRVARLSCGLRAIELHEHRIVDLVLKRLGDSDQIRFMRLFTHQPQLQGPWTTAFEAGRWCVVRATLEVFLRFYAERSLPFRRQGSGSGPPT